MNGMRPVFMHNRPDFVLLAFNQLVTHAAKFHFMDNGQTTVPMVVWAAIGRGWGSGAQHSQAIQGMLLGVPGLKIVMPSTPARRQGAAALGDPRQQPGLRLRASLADEEGRRRARGRLPRADRQGHLPAPRQRRHDRRRVARDRARRCRPPALLAAEGIDAEVIDLRTVKPLDEAIVLESLREDRAARRRRHGVDEGRRRAPRSAVSPPKRASRSEGAGAPRRPARHPDACRVHARAVLLSGRGADRATAAVATACVREA